MSQPYDNLVLVLTPDNPCNTTIQDQATGETYYTVKTEHGKYTCTRILNSEHKEIASWRWRDLRSDILTLTTGAGRGVTSPASEWLKESKRPFKSTVSFSDRFKRKYKWKGNGMIKPQPLQQLFADEDGTRPIAHVTKGRRNRDATRTPPTYTSSSSTLTLSPRAQEIMDKVVISFCLLEKEQRSRRIPP
ncbi:hypothetical protein FA15DRAFT_637306 [Coprinopsis marcescibilis]|uniref:DUF6593 domain-containing protein n=1 Tax=Coprinopsis marcescibilis TaxID=230819 RepID=A0A5C3L0Z2_COPMA|nr:hypothetical protein FA15DRAFT_637306 [Coprinopsis marcescibilis]